jgi:hypothetical protein
MSTRRYSGEVIIYMTNLGPAGPGKESYRAKVTTPRGTLAFTFQAVVGGRRGSAPEAYETAAYEALDYAVELDDGELGVDYYADRIKHPFGTDWAITTEQTRLH